MSTIHKKTTREIVSHLARKWGPINGFDKTGTKGVASVHCAGHGGLYLVVDTLKIDEKLVSLLADHVPSAIVRVAYQDGEYGYKGKFYSTQTHILRDSVETRTIIELEEDCEWALAAIFLTPEQLDKVFSHLAKGEASSVALSSIRNWFSSVFDVPEFAQALAAHEAVARANQPEPTR